MLTKTAVEALHRKVRNDLNDGQLDGWNDNRAHLSHLKQAVSLFESMGTTLVNRSVLDVGCGKEAYLTNCLPSNINSYLGIDEIHVPDKSPLEKKFRFKVTEFHSERLGQFDVAFCLGVLPYRIFDSSSEQYNYLVQVVKKLFTHSRHGFVFDFPDNVSHYLNDNSWFYYDVPTVASLVERNCPRCDIWLEESRAQPQFDFIGVRKK